MLASTEYLLCGLPIVSTPSIGGRDVWYNAFNHRIARPHKNEIAKAVAHFVNNPPDPAPIRDAAVSLSHEFRGILRKQVLEWSDRPLLPADGIAGSWFESRFVKVHHLDEFLASDNGSTFDRQDLFGY